MSTEKNNVHPLVRKVRALQGALADWRYNCDPKDLRAAMWLEADVEQLAIRLEAITHVPNGDNLDCLVGQFEVMHKIGEYEWEMSCGPYKTRKEAEHARLNWFNKDEIKQMSVVLFLPNAGSHRKEEG